MADEIPSYNLLISYSLDAGYLTARSEAERILTQLGDPKALIERSPVSGLMGVRTELDARRVLEDVRELCAEDPTVFRHTRKWMPVDAWCRAGIPDIQRAVEKVKELINPGERWTVQVERRPGAALAAQEVIAAVVPLVRADIDFEHPDKTLRIELVGPWAALAVLRERDVFSVEPLG